MSYKVVIVSKMDFGYRAVLEKEGKIPPTDIIEAKSVDEAVSTLDDLVSRGSDIGAIIHNLDVTLDRNKQFSRLMLNVKAKHPTVPVIVISIYDSKQPVLNKDLSVRQPEMSVAEALVREGVYAHVPIDVEPDVLIGWVRSALQEHSYRLEKSGHT